ncbi:MAG TPA: amino acid ABC transporter substrate-binding protein, partial [Caulobacteraceae bacterium]
MNGRTRIAATGLGLALAALSAGGCRDRGPEVRPAPAAPPSVPTPPPAAGARAAGPTLQAIRARGRLNCGVHQGLAGFAYTDNRGRWRGFDVDFCRATA